MRIKSTAKVFCYAIGVSLLSACVSLPEMLSFSSDDNNTNPPSNAFEPAAQGEMQSAIEQADLQETKRIVNGVLEEWQLLKPEINRVIKLESELAYLVDSFNKSSEIDRFVDSDTELLESSSAAELAGVVQSKEGYGALDAPGELLKIFGEPVSTNEAGETADNISVPYSQSQPSSELVLGSAQAITKMPSKSIPSQGVNDDKFSSLSDSRSTGVSAGVNIKQVNNSTSLASTDKFRDSSVANGNVAPRNIAKRNKNSVCQNSLLKSGSFAIHLSSLSNRANVRGAVNDLSTTFSDILCNKQVKTALVKVNGVDYSSIRFGPYLSEEEATQACSSVRTQGRYCKVTSFTGESI
ncbi:SPOR domain-containing protein [Glaciecola siphonariae]|uniref:SPOR domain-containing protein n=1 Tax=Glaciecola siphonariae TaxID=521012 RepID=A0ABV9LWP3_9ALTE